MITKRILFLDLETTGLDLDKNRIIEIGIAESIDGFVTNNNLQLYIKPDDVQVELGATKVHGITTQFLQNKPTFAEQAGTIIKFIQGSHSIIAHNAIFDVSFMNKELKLAGYQPLHYYCLNIKDSLALARNLHPLKANDLSALCRRYDVSLQNRDFHGALIDAVLLQEVFFKILEQNPEAEPVRDFWYDVQTPCEVYMDSQDRIKSYHASAEDQLKDSSIYNVLQILEQIKQLEQDLK